MQDKVKQTDSTEIELADPELKRALALWEAPDSRRQLDERVTASFQAEARLLLESGQSDIALRKWVGISLVFLFVVSVIMTYVVVLLIGFGLMVLPYPLLATIVSGTIGQAALLYRRVIRSLFHQKPSNRRPATPRSLLMTR